MRVEFVIHGFVDLDPGFRLRVDRRDYVVLQFSVECFDDAGRKYHRYEVEIGAPEHYQHCDEEILAIDLDNDKRVMSWRTSGLELFDVETMRGTFAESPFAELRRHFFDSNVAKEIRLKAIRAEVEAMDWPEVIEE